MAPHGWEPDAEDDFLDMGLLDHLASTPNQPTECPVLNFPLSPVQDPSEFQFALDDSDVNPERGAGRIIYSSEEDLTPPPELTTTCLGRWEPKLVEVNKYVDDNLQEESVNFENVQDILRVKDKHAVATQNAFRHIVR